MRATSGMFRQHAWLLRYPSEAFITEWLHRIEFPGTTTLGTSDYTPLPMLVKPRTRHSGDPIVIPAEPVTRRPPRPAAEPKVNQFQIVAAVLFPETLELYFGIRHEGFVIRPLHSGMISLICLCPFVGPVRRQLDNHVLPNCRWQSIRIGYKVHAFPKPVQGVWKVVAGLAPQFKKRPAKRRTARVLVRSI